MLWKYKKVYQETSRDIVNPPVKACIRLINVSATYAGGGESRFLLVQHILCGDETNTVIENTIEAFGTETVILTLNQCIKEGSLFINGVNVIDETPQNIDDFDVLVDFEDCQDPCSEAEEEASVINNVVYQDFPAGYLVDCVLNSYCFLQYSEDGTTWITYPTLYPPGANTFLVALNNDKLKFRFISRCEEILSNEFTIFCYRIEEFEFQDGIPGVGHTATLIAIKCNGDTEESINITDGIYPINECVNISTINISSSLGSINTTYTQVQVEDAILSNSGNISRVITDGENIIGSVRIKFSQCV